MKPFYLSVCILLALNFTSIDFYDISIELLDGAEMKMSAYRGRKVVIAVVSGNDAGLNMVHYLDSVQQANKGLQVIIIPTGDFGGRINMRDLESLKKNKTIVLTKPFKVKKANGAQQHKLLSWLTKSSENKHFNIDVEGEGQVFIVSGKGTLYAVMPKGTPVKYISKAVNQVIIE
jgi:glutathione peroxidase-family protein